MGLVWYGSFGRQILRDPKTSSSRDSVYLFVPRGTSASSHKVRVKDPHRVLVLYLYSTMPSLRLIKTLWGIEEPIGKTLFDSIRQEGYHGVEVIRLAWMDEKSAEALVKSLNDAKLSVVCQIHTAGGFLRQGEYVYCDEFNVESHVASFAEQLSECQDLILKVHAGGFVNVHAGVDAWTQSEALSFLRACMDLMETVDFPVTFETHRQRLFCNPFQTRELLQIESLHSLRLNADLSHWYCACERVFDPSTGRDAKWWPEVVQLLERHVAYIHARFGWAQGPQIADPSDPACETEKTLQMQVWHQLLEAMQKRDGGDCFVCPEYGPPPYLPVMPHTQEPVASLAHAVSFTKGYIEGLFDEFM